MWWEALSAEPELHLYMVRSDAFEKFLIRGVSFLICKIWVMTVSVL